MQGYLEEILERIQDLLMLHTPENGFQEHLSGDDQLFLYETAGILVVQSQFPAEVSMVNNFFGPAGREF